MSEDMIVDLDLNQEPLDPVVGSVMGLGLGSSLNDFQTSHWRIEDRIRQLEAVTARARQRQRWRQARNSNEMNHISIVPTVDLEHEIGDPNEAGSVSVRENAAERGNGKSCKRDSSYLVAKALEMDLDDKKASNSSSSSGSFYDCNICLDMAKEPILTCCGHLFCWVCFFKLPYVDSTAKECPVCKGEVTDTNITPIYGNGNDTRVSEMESTDSKLPPRPRARRVESVRQQRVNRGASNVPFVEVLRQIRDGINAAGGASNLDPDTISQVFPSIEAGGGGPPLLSRQVSSVAIRSALVNAGRLVHGLLRRTDSENLEGALQDTSAIQPESQIMDSTAEINSSSSRNIDRLATVVAMENVTSDMTVEANAIVPDPSLSARRRTRVSRVFEREPRRRRLR